MQKDLSDNPGGPNKAVKYALMAFVAVSICSAAYKTVRTHEKTPAPPVEAAAVSPVPPAQAAIKAPALTARPKAKPAAGLKTATVYYFYTSARCSSCKAIEAYTREAVEKNFASVYNGWHVTFKGVNIEDEPNRRFVQDYWLNTKSVVVQKFSGDKALKYRKLEKVWELLGDKFAFMNYVTDQTKSLLDEK